MAMVVCGEHPPGIDFVLHVPYTHVTAKDVAGRICGHGRHSVLALAVYRTHLTTGQNTLKTNV